MEQGQTKTHDRRDRCRRGRTWAALVLAVGLLLGPAADAPAQAPPPAPAAAPAAPPPVDPVAELAAKVGDLKVAADTIWVLVAAFLVFLMNLGFAMVGPVGGRRARPRLPLPCRPEPPSPSSRVIAEALVDVA
jgi:hypothetical protein